MTAVPGIVLAGGESRRMGQDKALMRLGGRPLVAWTVDRLAPQCGALAIARHDGRLDGIDLGLPLLADGDADRVGPLAGLLAGLDWAAAAAPDAKHAVTVAVDSPFLPGDVVARLSAARQAGGAAAAVASSGGRRHPVVALWPVTARHALRTALRHGGLRRIGLFLDGFAPATVEWPTDPFDPFLNLNAPEDVATAEAVLARMCHAAHDRRQRQDASPPTGAASEEPGGSRPC